MGITVVLNPIHDYMVRHEMKKKRKYFSTNGRTVVSVLNKGKGREPVTPWTVYRDGEDLSSIAIELPVTVPGRPDIKIGIMSL